MISACIIVKNEEMMLSGCLTSIKPIADEIIVVDTGSTDKTLEIARKFGAKTFNFEWNSDFSSARNFSLEKASGDWIIVIDADEILEQKDQEGIKKLVLMKDFDAFSVIQRTYTDESSNLEFVKLPQKRYGFSGYFDVEVIRIFRNNGYKYSGKVHEIIDDSLKDAKIGRTDVIFHHLEHMKGTVRQKQLNYLKICLEEIDAGNKSEKMLCDAALLTFNYKKDYPEAEKLLQNTIKIHPGSVRTHLLLGQMYFQQGEFEKAIKAYETAKDIPNAPAQIIEKNIQILKSLRANKQSK